MLLPAVTPISVQLSSGASAISDESESDEWVFFLGSSEADVSANIWSKINENEKLIQNYFNVLPFTSISVHSSNSIASSDQSESVG